MQISKKAWMEYIQKMSAISKKAADEMQNWIARHGFADDQAMLEYAYSLATHYGEAIAALSCQMYESTAAAQGVVIRSAEPAPTPKFGEVAKAVHGTMKESLNKVPGTVGRMVKQTGADTTLLNAKRDGIWFAWISQGDTCPYCLMMSAIGWQRAGKKTLQGGHAYHIHPNCDCQYAIDFKGDMTIEGYDPEKMRDEIMAIVDPDGSKYGYFDSFLNHNGRYSSDIVARNRTDLNRIRMFISQKSGKFIGITDQAINKVKIIGPKSWDNEKKEKVQNMNKQVLKLSKKNNKSQEVAIILKADGNMGKPVYGNENTIDVFADPEMAHELRSTNFRSIIFSHNHPSLSYFSGDDIDVFLRSPSIGTMQVVTNRGKVWFIHKKDNYDDIAMLDLWYEIGEKNRGKKIDDIVELFLKESYNSIERNR